LLFAIQHDTFSLPTRHLFLVVCGWFFGSQAITFFLLNDCHVIVFWANTTLFLCQHDTFSLPTRHLFFAVMMWYCFT